MKSIPYLILLLLLSACRSTFVTDLTARPGQILYFDNFSDPASGWMHSAATQGSMDYDGGTYRMTVATPDYDIWAVSGQNYRDVRVEADVTRLAGPDSNRFGLICRYDGAEDFYFFIVSSDGYFAIGKSAQGFRSLLDQEMMSYSPAIFTGSGPNHLRFDCIDSTLTAYVNAQAIAITHDPDFTDGDAGVIAGAFDQPNVDMAFDNFVVYQP